MNNTPQPGTYRIDPSRSLITFATRHLFGLGAVEGRRQRRARHGSLTEAGGELSDGGSLNGARGELSDGGSLTETEEGTSRHCALTEADGRWTLLTVGGITLPVDLAIERAQTAGHVLTGTASTGIDRYAFGVTGMKGLAARRLSCRIEIVATRSAQ